MPESQIDKSKNNLMKFGSGMTSFFDMLKNLIEMIAILSLISCFDMLIYDGRFPFLKDRHEELVHHMETGGIDFRNMGFSKSVCVKARL